MKDYFKPRAQLLLQLGEQLIKNESIAVVELVKNSYDADAINVLVKMNDITSPLFGEIIIEDDGDGMTRDIIENVWLEPGNSHKKDMVSNNKRTRLGRLPLGEKGIGRFGVHKLGHCIKLITKAKDCNEIELNIDWDNFEEAKYLEDIKIDIIERAPKYIAEKGTIIIISKLRQEWALKSFKQVERAIDNLNSPFKKKTDFTVELKCNIPGWKEEITSFDKIKQYALYHFEASVDKLSYANCLYHFMPFSTMKGVEARSKSENQLLEDEKQKALNQREEKDNKGNTKIIQMHKIGSFDFELFVFDRESTIVQKYIIDGKRNFKNYLNENGGIYVFRDGLRIYDYGEKGNDWLELDKNRINQPAAKLSNNIIIGAVFLNREQSNDLIEKANREGFIENEAFNVFKAMVNRLLEIFLCDRNIDKDKIRTLKSVNEPLTTSMKKLRTVVEKSDADEKYKNDMFKYIDIIDKEYSYLKDITLSTASAGLSYGVIIHEIEKIIKELSTQVLEEPSINSFKEKILHLSDIVENYANLLRNREASDTLAISIVKQAKFNCDYRFKVHNIKFEIDETSFGNIKINCASSLIVSSLMNIFDNSIWWIEEAKKNEKRIFVKLIKYKDMNTILIADNGKGFLIKPEDAVKMFVSKKPGGMGLGLNIVNEIMISHNGELVFPSFTEVNIDNDFQHGAIIGLAFKN